MGDRCWGMFLRRRFRILAYVGLTCTRFGLRITGYGIIGVLYSSWYSKAKSR